MEVALKSLISLDLESEGVWKTHEQGFKNEMFSSGQEIPQTYLRI